MIPNKIVVHCAATPEGDWFTAADIDRWHKERGWRGIGYHKVVLLDGIVEPGRPEHQQGAHVAGHNRDSLAVCYIGGVAENNRTPKDTRTPAQRDALRAVVNAWMSKYDIPAERVLGHYELDARKACPSFDMDVFRLELGSVPTTREPIDHVKRLDLGDLPQIGGPDVSMRIRRLQVLLGVMADGWIGPVTYAAIRSLRVE